MNSNCVVEVRPMLSAFRQSLVRGLAALPRQSQAHMSVQGRRIPSLVSPYSVRSCGAQKREASSEAGPEIRSYAWSVVGVAQFVHLKVVCLPISVVLT